MRPMKNCKPFNDVIIQFTCTFQCSQTNVDNTQRGIPELADTVGLACDLLVTWMVSQK